MSYKMKKIGISLLLLMGMILLSGLVSAVNVSIDKVKIDGDELSDTSTTSIRGIDRGEEFEIRVEVSANEDVDNAQIEVRLTGLRRDTVKDETSTFDMEAGVTYVKKLFITLPERTDADTFNLRVRVDDRSGDTTQKDYTLRIIRPDALVSVRDVIFNPIDEVKAGRSLLTVVRLTNRGEDEETGVKVTVSIPALGIAASDFVEDLDPDESTTTEELFMRIPANAEAGEYDVRIEVEFDDGDASRTFFETITVVSDEAAPAMFRARTTVTVPGSKSVGTAATVYPITITNGGSASTTYTLSVSGVDSWGSFTLEPSNVLVVPAGGTSTAFLSVTANAGVSGTYTFAVDVTTSDGTETLTLEADVDGGTASTAGTGTFRRALEIGLIVLVILLVVIGLIVGYNRMRGEEGEDKESETYY